MIAVKRRSSINTFGSDSIFDEPIYLDGKRIDVIERNDAELWDLSDIFESSWNPIFKRRQ